MKSTIVWIILFCVLVTVSTFYLGAQSTSMADLIVVTIFEVVIEVTVSVVLHLAVRDVLDGPDLEIGVSLPIRVVEGLTQGVEVGRPGRQFETVR